MSTSTNLYPSRPKGSTCSIRTYIQSRTQRVTLTLLLVSCSFLLLNSPYCAIWIVNYLTRFQNRTLKSVKEICELFTLTNFCINFLLYCVSGKVFRNELVSLMRCQWRAVLENNEERRMRRLSRSKLDLQLHNCKVKTYSPSLQVKGQSEKEQRRFSFSTTFQRTAFY